MKTTKNYKQLTDVGVQAYKPHKKLYRVADGGSLFLCIYPSGVKSWQFRYRKDGALKSVNLGQYPDVRISQARNERDKLKGTIAGGQDPQKQKEIAREEENQQVGELKQKRAKERAARETGKLTFERVAMEWHESHVDMRLWTKQHEHQVLQSLKDHVFPLIGSKVLDAVTTKDVFGIIADLVKAGKLESASRVYQRMGAVFRYGSVHHAITNGAAAMLKDEVSKLLRQALKKQPAQNFPCIQPREFPGLLRALRMYPGPGGRLTWLIALTAVRTSEARKASVDEFDLDLGVWTIPKERMGKVGIPHVVPLSRQAKALVEEIISENEGDPRLFPHPNKRDRYASENAVLYVLGALGYQGRMSGHGFRTLFSTIGNEAIADGKLKTTPEMIEVSLHHLEDNDVRAAYLRTAFVQQRRPLMQWWADELDRLESSQVESKRAA
jgi:integrase